MSKPRRTRIRLLAAERSELERRVAARTASQQDAYRAQIILGAAAGESTIAERQVPHVRAHHRPTRIVPQLLE
jgi:hypothetical protein